MEKGMDLKTRRKLLKAKIRSIVALPTVPHILDKLSKMAADPTVSVKDMGRVIEKDQSLTSKILKLANSAFYGFPRRISTVSDAIVLLGFNVVRSLVLCSSIFEGVEKENVSLWEHSMGTALVAGSIARKLGHKNPEEVSTAALLHDIGKIIIMNLFRKEYEEIKRMVRLDPGRSLELEEEVLGFNHADIGAILADHWNLPLTLVEPIETHHNPSASRKLALESSIVHFSDVLIRALGYADGVTDIVPAVDERAWAVMGLKRHDLIDVVMECEESIIEVKGVSLG